MNPERWQEVREILDRAIELSPAERAKYLESRCTDDNPLRAEVEALPYAHQSASTAFLKNPAADLKRILPVLPAASNRIGSRLGVYQIVEEIGHGGMGEVYRANNQRRVQTAARIAVRSLNVT